MPKTPTQLSDLAARKAKSKDIVYTLPSGRGLAFILTWGSPMRTKQRTNCASGSAWASRQREMYGRRRAEMASKSKAEAEVERLAEEARKHSFTVISDAWLDDRKSGWAPATYDKSVFIVQKRLQPLLGRVDMRTLASKDVVPVLVDLATATPSIAVKARQYLNGIVDYCIVRGIRGDDQLLRLQRALPRHRGSHIPAVTKIQGVGPLIRAIQGYEGRVVRGGLAAGRLCSLPARRSGISPLGRDGSRAS